MRRHLNYVVVVAVLIVAADLGFFSVDAGQNGVRGQAPLANSLTQNFLVQHEIGRRFHIDPADLPPPKTGAIVTDRPLIVPYSGQGLQVPPGFTATPFATGLVNPRRLLVLPNGDVLVAEQRAGYLTLLRDDGSGYAHGLTVTSRTSTNPTVWLGGTTTSLLPIKTASGACHTISAPFALAAVRQSASIKYRLTNVRRHRGPTALR